MFVCKPLKEHVAATMKKSEHINFLRSEHFDATLPAAKNMLVFAAVSNYC